MRYVDIICLANSRKLGGRCVAGIDVSTGRWIRPISSLEHGELSRSDIALPDGRDPRILDLIRVPLGARSTTTEPHQVENYVALRSPWLAVPKLPPNRIKRLILKALIDDPLLFGTATAFITRRAVELGKVSSSLCVIRPSHGRVYRSRNSRGDPQLRAIFEARGIEYDLPLTDVLLEKQLSTLPFRRQVALSQLPSSLGLRGDTLITVSLGESYNGRCYKLAAAIFSLT